MQEGELMMQTEAGRITAEDMAYLEKEIDILEAEILEKIEELRRLRRLRA